MYFSRHCTQKNRVKKVKYLQRMQESVGWNEVAWKYSEKLFDDIVWKCPRRTFKIQKNSSIRHLEMTKFKTNVRIRIRRKLKNVSVRRQWCMRKKMRNKSVIKKFQVVKHVYTSPTTSESKLFVIKHAGNDSETKWIFRTLTEQKALGKRSCMMIAMTTPANIIEKCGFVRKI